MPQVDPVFSEVARVLRPGGIYCTHFHNPFTFGVDEHEWTEKGYPIRLAYLPGTEHPDPSWDFESADGSICQMTGPREFRHTLSEILNGLAQRGFVLQGFWEESSPLPLAAPGSWEHYLAVCVPYFNLWMRYLPTL